MVHGLEHFSKRMVALKEHYILVGGVAGDLLMSELGGDFRATKDLDIVIFMRPDLAFLNALAEYIKDGEYENKEKGEGVTQFYRFSKPKKLECPKQIELFSKKPDDMKLFDEQHIIPIQKIENGAQFSGILLEDEYYNLIKENSIEGEYCKFITAVAQIPLKARAFNELRERRDQGIQIDENDIKKHRNDILLFSSALPIGEKLNLKGLPLSHMKTYLSQASTLSKDQGIRDFCKRKSLGPLEDILTALREFYF